eukprot:5065872-Ditylum_brightwellii.AAC.1
MNAAALLPPVPRVWCHPEIGTLFKVQQYWNAVLSFKRNTMDSSRKLDKLKGKLPEDADIFQGDPARGIKGQLRKAAKNLRQARLDCFQKNQDYLEKKAILLVHEEDPVKENNKISKVVQRFRDKERGCKMYQTFKISLKAAQNATLSYVDVPDYDETWLVLLA